MKVVITSKSRPDSPTILIPGATVYIEQQQKADYPIGPHYIYTDNNIGLRRTRNIMFDDNRNTDILMMDDDFDYFVDNDRNRVSLEDGVKMIADIQDKPLVFTLLFQGFAGLRKNSKDWTKKPTRLAQTFYFNLKALPSDLRWTEEKVYEDADMQYQLDERGIDYYLWNRLSPHEKKMKSVSFSDVNAINELVFNTWMKWPHKMDVYKKGDLLTWSKPTKKGVNINEAIKLFREAGFQPRDMRPQGFLF
jgi:hypothetical protein